MELLPVQDSDKILHIYQNPSLSPTAKPTETMEGPYDHDDEPHGYSTVIAGPNLNQESTNQGSRHTEESNKQNDDGARQQRRPDCLPLIKLLLTISILVLVILIFKGKY